MGRLASSKLPNLIHLQRFKNCFSRKDYKTRLTQLYSPPPKKKYVRMFHFFSCKNKKWAFFHFSLKKKKINRSQKAYFKISSQTQNCADYGITHYTWTQDTFLPLVKLLSRLHADGDAFGLGRIGGPGMGENAGLGPRVFGILIYSL